MSQCMVPNFFFFLFCRAVCTRVCLCADVCVYVYACKRVFVRVCANACLARVACLMDICLVMTSLACCFS